MQRRRVFIAINLPEDIKRSLAAYQKKWPEIPVRWTKPENLHITLDFIGYIRDEELVEICKKTKEAVSRHSPFKIKLSKICYGPIDKKPPRMIWAAGEKSREFFSLKEDFDKALGISENREFSPHITLGRIKKWEWQRIDPEDRPIIDESIDLGFSVNSVEVMESTLKRGGAEYTTLESFNLTLNKL